MAESAPQDSDPAIVVALGSSLAGDFASTAELLEAALAALSAEGLKVTRRSRWWRSAAWPDATQPAFLNGVALIETGLGPEAVMARLHAVEARFGRVRHAANAPRTLDLDLVAYGRLAGVIGGVVLPHPRAADRRFVMGPLAEIAPEWRHPVLGATARELSARAPVGADASPVP